MTGKAIAGIIILTVVITIVGAFVGSWLWNNTISDQLRWTQHITAWQFFKIELIAWLLHPSTYHGGGKNKN